MSENELHAREDSRRVQWGEPAPEPERASRTLVRARRKTRSHASNRLAALCLFTICGMAATAICVVSRDLNGGTGSLPVFALSIIIAGLSVVGVVGNLALKD